jgi:hypothetical protein
LLLLLLHLLKLKLLGLGLDLLLLLLLQMLLQLHMLLNMIRLQLLWMYLYICSRDCHRLLKRHIAHTYDPRWCLIGISHKRGSSLNLARSIDGRDRTLNVA